MIKNENIYMKLLLALLLSFHFKSFSQASYSVVKHLNINNGLPTNTVYQVEFDKYGKSFIASDKGIIIYDGKHIDLLTKQKGLPDNEVFYLKLKDSLLYFLPLKGNVYAFNIYESKYKFNEVLKTNEVLKYMLIKDSLFYVCTYGHILSKKINKTEEATVLNFRWNIDAYLFNDNFYVKGNGYLLKLNLDKNRIDTIPIKSKKLDALYVDDIFYYTYKNIFYLKNIYSSISDSFKIKGLKDNVFIKTITKINDTLFFINTSDNTLDLLNLKNHITTPILSNVAVNNIKYNQRDNSFFISTNNGLYIVKKYINNYYNTNTFNQNISYFSVTDDGKKNIGLENGSFLVDDYFYNYNDYKVTSLLSYKDILFCGQAVSFKLIDRLKKKVIYNFDKNSIKNAVNVDSVVFITTSKQLLKFNLNSFKRDTIIAKNHRSYYLQYHKKTLYTQSYNTDTLFAIDLKTENITSVAHLKGQVIKSIEKNGSIYFLTDLGHLYIYLQKQIRHINLLDYIHYPLSNFSIFEYYENHFIMGNNDACISSLISDIEKNKFSFHHFKLSLPQNSKFVQVYTNKMYYVLENNINYIPLNHAPFQDYDYQLINKQSQTLLYRSNMLSKPFGNFKIDFESVNYFGKNEVINYYLITPTNKVYKQQKSTLSISLDSLSIGRNFLIVFATDNNLNNSNILLIPINIEDTSTIKIIRDIIIYTIILTLILFLIFKYRIKLLQKRYKINMEHVLMEQKASALLMSPHFVFNALANLQGFIGAKQLDKANAYLLKFSLVIRSYLNFMQQGVVTLDKELESLHNFIEFQKIKYDDRLHFKVVKEKGVIPERVVIPAFVIQPFIENSIKYFTNHGASIEIEVGISDIINNHYTITIQDNGPGLKKQLSKSDLLNKRNAENLDFKSLSFTLQRLKKVHEAHHLEFDFSIENRYNTDKSSVVGLTVILVLNQLPHKLNN